MPHPLSKILPTHNYIDVATCIFFYFEVGQSCSLERYFGENVWNEIILMHKARYDKEPRNNNLKNATGGQIAQKIFQYSKTMEKIMIWRYQ